MIKSCKISARVWTKPKPCWAGARRVAENTPIQLEAARAAEQQASARYKVGLGTIVEVAEAQRLLTRAEIDDSPARQRVASHAGCGSRARRLGAIPAAGWQMMFSRGRRVLLNCLFRHMKRVVIFTFFLMAGLAFAAGRGEEIRLWPNGAPGSEGITAPELSKPSTSPKYGKLPGNFTVTHYPSLYVFLPPKEKATGAALVVAPGGGHTQLVIEKEGWEIADWLNDHGISAFVLKYRLARAQGSKYTLAKEVYADAARSIRLVRSRAREWGVDPSRIGVIGFSAGGEVAGMIETKFDAGDPNAADPIERASSRPDFSILIYPFYRPGSAPLRTARMGAAPPAPAAVANTPDSAAALPPALTPITTNPDFPVPDDAPPVFMVCATDDPSHVVPTVKFYLELQAHHIPAEMHIYDYGGHGFALRPTKKPGSPVESWPARLIEWLAVRGILEYPFKRG